MNLHCSLKNENKPRVATEILACWRGQTSSRCKLKAFSFCAKETCLYLIKIIKPPVLPFQEKNDK